MPAFDRILQLARMEEMDCEFVEVTAHEGARPTHAVWQSRFYHRGGAVVQDGERYEDFEAATGYGTGPGLCGWNCRHNFYPFYPGISVRNYTDERLAELDARNIPYGGGLYTRYEITQMQRALERRVRKYKRRYLAETAAEVDRAGTAVLPPCSTPQQLTEHQNKNTRRGTAGAFILVDHFPPQSNTFLLLHSSKNSSTSPFSMLVIGISAGVFWPRGLNQIRK